MGVAVASNGKALGKPFKSAAQSFGKVLHFQQVADDKQGDGSVVTVHPIKHPFPPGEERFREAVGRSAEGFLAPCGVALVLRQVPEIVGVDREPSGHVRPPAQGQQDGGGEERSAR